MALRTFASVNKALSFYNVQLYKGDGYLYYVLDTPADFQTLSIYACYFKDLPAEKWVKMGIDFSNKCWHRFNGWDEEANIAA